MPLSNYLHIPAVVYFATGVKPKRILDVGVGMGCYGFLMRQYCDILRERVSKHQWETSIDGVEIFDGYENPVWNYAYNNVFRGDIRALLPQLPDYDVAICADVLEHMPKQDAHDLVNQLLRKARTVIATTPSTEYPQGDWGGNPAEAHHCTLSKNDLPSVVAIERTGITTCFVCTIDREHDILIRKLRKESPRLQRFHIDQLPRKVVRRILRLIRR